MSKYDHNSQSVGCPAESSVDTCSYNAGEIIFGKGTTIRLCCHNLGTLHFGEHSKIESISHNYADIFIEDNSRIATIKHNSGRIFLGNNCFVDTIYRNTGIISGGPGSEKPKEEPDPDIVPIKIKNKCKERPDLLKTLEVGMPWLMKLKSGEPTAPAEDNICWVCSVKPRNTSFLCGHVCCETCARTLTICHMCRGPVTQRIRLFL